MMKNILNKRTCLEIVILAWILTAFLFQIHTNHDGHDFHDHLKYTETIIEKHKLPESLNENPLANHPPAYYLINSVISPKKENRIFHVIYVRVISVIMGGIFLLTIFWFLNKITENSLINMLVLLYVATTPKFAFTFSTYNNDALAIFLSGFLILLSYSIAQKYSIKSLLLLLFVSVLGIYTKYNVAWLMCVISIICFVSFIFTKTNKKKYLSIIAVFILSIILHTPYLYFNNYKKTGSLLMPATPVWKFESNPTIKKFLYTLNSISSNPLLLRTPNVWREPWAYPGWIDVSENTKRGDFLTFSFVSSIIGELYSSKIYIYYVWALLIVHFLMYFLSLFVLNKSTLTRLAFLIIVLSYFIDLIILSLICIPPIFGCSMDYRYICWTWLCWAILYSSLLSNKNKFITASLMLLITIGIVCNILTIVSM